MTLKLEVVLEYLRRNYPGDTPPDEPLLVRLAYLADWQSAQQRRQQISSARWSSSHHGPYCREDDPVLEDAGDHRGGTAEGIPREDAEILDEVMSATAQLPWDELVVAVYATYPMRARPRDIPLDLVALAEECEERQGGSSLARVASGMAAVVLIGAAGAAGGSVMRSYRESRALGGSVLGSLVSAVRFG